MNRPKYIRSFVKRQLAEGKTIIYAYKDKEKNVWIKMKPEEIEKVRKSISPSISRERDNFESFKNPTSLDIHREMSELEPLQTSESRILNNPMIIRERPKTRATINQYYLESIIEENKTAEKQARPLSHYNAPVVIRDLLAGKVTLPNQNTRNKN